MPVFYHDSPAVRARKLEVSRKCNERKRRRAGIKPRRDLSNLSAEEKRALKAAQSAARQERLSAFDPTGTIPLLRKFMSIRIDRVPAPGLTPELKYWSAYG